MRFAMSFSLECQKMKRTGLTPSFLCGGLLAAAVPVLNMAVRSEMYLIPDVSPVQILQNANWQLMAMLNILLVTAGSCILYHTEYDNDAIQKMHTLLPKESRLFFSKAALLSVLCLWILLIETAGTAFCSYHWFSLSKEIWTELFKSLGYTLLLILPAVSASLFIASACKNMWVSLGIGVVCIFTATMLPAENFVLSLFPFALPFQIFAGTAENTVHSFMLAAALELIILSFAEIIFLKVRRSFE